VWLVDFMGRREMVSVVQEDYVGDLSVHFNRLLTFSQQAALRSSYETEINSILRDFTAEIIFPLKRHRTEQGGTTAETPVRPAATSPFTPTAFLGHSFEAKDAEVVEVVTAILGGIGVKVVTGKKPKAERISDKVKELIDQQFIFVGLFTRRFKLQGRKGWTTSPWIIDEKAYAVAKGKVLILLTEQGVESIGGLQGDYEYLPFARNRLQQLTVDLLALFSLSPSSMA
jgi:hypothetical protein